MNVRKRFLVSQAGFSLVGTLVAVAIGGIVAALVATVISDSVRGQRAIIDRDEASEFTLFVKNLLMSDTSCNQIMVGKTLAPAGAALLDLPSIGYANQPPTTIGNGYRFSNDTLQIEDFTFENTTTAPVQLKVTLEQPAGSGNYVNRLVRRHMVRVKLAVANVAVRTFYRPRFFEFPVLVNASNEIEACNNEVNAGDACQSMGFRWDTGSNPPVCIPDTACVYGGHYRLDSTGDCVDAHDVTGTCACPAGYDNVEVGATNISAESDPCSKRCDTIRLFHYTTVQCFKCN